MNGAIPNGCPYCGCYWHSGVCPRIEAIEYHQSGSIKKITFRDEMPKPMQVTVTAPDWLVNETRTFTQQVRAGVHAS